MEKGYDYKKMSTEGYECQCEAAGYCPLLGRQMSESLYSLCKTDSRYRSLFLETAQKKGIHDIGVQKKFNHKQKEQSELHSKADSVILELKENGMEVDNISEGLGDTIEKVLSKFGINNEKIESILGSQGCGCSERKKWFNKIFSYNKESSDE
tara:strand:+ start:81 stop:539 length:459 start_codon:yes stop_codon:yes gene_type:complete